jgi:hypothetical protein
VSGSRTQTSTDAVRCFVLAVADATTNTARPRTARPLTAIAVDLRKTFLKVTLSFVRWTGAREPSTLADSGVHVKSLGSSP